MEMEDDKNVKSAFYQFLQSQSEYELNKPKARNMNFSLSHGPKITIGGETSHYFTRIYSDGKYPTFEVEMKKASVKELSDAFLQNNWNKFHFTAYSNFTRII